MANKRRNNPYGYSIQNNNYGLGNIDNTVPFQGIVFNPSSGYEPVEQDYKPLEQAYTKQENRWSQYETANDLLTNEFGKIRDQLNMDDPETRKWWNDKMESYRTPIKEASARGDWATAMSLANRFSADLNNDTEVQDRIDHYAKYKAWLGEMDTNLKQGTISQEAYNWAKETNPYKFEYETDSEGNRVKYKDWDVDTPYKKIDWTTLAKTGFELNKPNTSDWTRHNADGSWSSGKNATVTTAEIFDAAWHALTAYDPDWEKRARQEMEISLYNLNKLKNDKDALQDEYEKQEYLNKVINLFGDANENAEYRRLVSDGSEKSKELLAKLNAKRKEWYNKFLENTFNGQYKTLNSETVANYVRNKLWTEANALAYKQTETGSGEATGQTPASSGVEMTPSNAMTGVTYDGPPVQVTGIPYSTSTTTTTQPIPYNSNNRTPATNMSGTVSNVQVNG